MYCINIVTIKLLLFSGMCFLTHYAATDFFYPLFDMNSLTNSAESIT